MPRIRLMAANLTSGSSQTYDPGHGIRIFQGAHPDVAMIQEFNYGTNSAADVRAFVDAAFGPGFSYFRESGAQIPNGIVSRWPIVASGEWDDTSVANRDFAWARIDIPVRARRRSQLRFELVVYPPRRDADTGGRRAG